VNILMPEAPENWTTENGKERLVYAENAVGRVYLTSPMSPLQPGYMLKSTTSGREMDRIYDKLNAQEREHNEQLVESLYLRGRERYEILRGTLRHKMGLASTSAAEKNLIREALKLMDAKDDALLKQTATGAAAIQQTDAHGQKVKDEERQHEVELHKRENERVM
jgi:hypothetical protein